VALLKKHLTSTVASWMATINRCCRSATHTVAVAPRHHQGTRAALLTCRCAYSLEVRIIAGSLVPIAERHEDGVALLVRRSV
jgi:hypothetical protein